MLFRLYGVISLTCEQFHIIRCFSDFLLVIKWSCVIIIRYSYDVIPQYETASVIIIAFTYHLSPTAYFMIMTILYSPLCSSFLTGHTLYHMC